MAKQAKKREERLARKQAKSEDPEAGGGPEMADADLMESLGILPAGSATGKDDAKEGTETRAEADEAEDPSRRS